MASIKISLFLLMMLTFLNTSSGRRAYFPDEDDELDNIEGQDSLREPRSSQKVIVKEQEEKISQPLSNKDETKRTQYSPQTAGHTLSESSDRRLRKAHHGTVPEGEEVSSRKELRRLKFRRSHAHDEFDNGVTEEDKFHDKRSFHNNEVAEESEELTPCTCGIFLSSQYQKGSKAPPTGDAVVINEMDTTFQCNHVGNKQCITKCLELLIKHLPNSPALICAAVDHDIYKEKAALFVKNCKDEWHNSNLSAGREYCCKDNEYYKCPSS